VLELLAKYPGSNATEMEARLKTPKRTIERWLKQLRDQQLIEFRGSPKTGGYHLKSNQNKHDNR
jgi:ATP-dependent DNA helicase RecG